VRAALQAVGAEEAMIDEVLAALAAIG